MRKKRNDLAGYILAGGRGKRMGGRQKLYLRYQGKYLSLWVMEALRSLEDFYISVAEIPKETVGNAGWITDLYKEAGPLGGILSGLLQCPQEALFVVPCDTFGLDEEMVETLIREYERSGRPVFYRTETGPEPFPGIYTKEMIPVMERQHTAGNYRMKSLFETQEAKKYTFLDGPKQLEKLVNLNTEQEYRRLQRRNDGQEDSDSERSAGTDEKSSC